MDCRCLRSESSVQVPTSECLASAPIASDTGLNRWSIRTHPENSCVDLADLGGGRVLTLGQAVNPVVEQQDLQVHVAAKRVDQVIAADGQRVAVTGDDPNREVLARGGETGRDRRRTAVDRVHAVRVHVVREARRAADTRDEDDVLARDVQLGHEALHRGEDGVVTAPRAPAHFLVALEILRLKAEIYGLRHARSLPAAFRRARRP